MPTYDYFCKKCNENFTVVLSVKEHDEGKAECPKCRGKDLDQQVAHFMTKTSRKS